METQQLLPIGRHGIPMEIEASQPSAEATQRLAAARRLCAEFRRHRSLLADDKRLFLASEIEATK